MVKIEEENITKVLLGKDVNYYWSGRAYLEIKSDKVGELYLYYQGQSRGWADIKNAVSEALNFFFN